MNLSPVNAAASTIPLPESKPASAPPASASAGSPIQDTVTLSPQAQKSSGGADVDHDGDSH